MEAGKYLEVISLIERLHRYFLELIKFQLDSLGIQDINNVQALMLFNIGDVEMTIGELTSRGLYLGSNVSYNVKKMVENGYLAALRSEHDLRSVNVKLTDKGHYVSKRLGDMHKAHLDMLAQSRITESDLEAASATLRQLERFWMEASNPFGRRVQDLGGR